MPQFAVMESVAARLEAMGHQVLRCGREWRSQCPAHSGDGMNFSFAEENGRLLATCHSHHCSFDEIVNALDLPKERSMTENTPLRANSPRKRGTGPRGKKVHATLKAATLAAAFSINSRLGREPDQIFPYVNSDGSESLFACRWNLSSDEQTRLRITEHKQIRYVSRWKTGYIVGTDPDTHYPIYHMNQIAEALRLESSDPVQVCVCEGEKATERCTELGMLATCTPFGSESAARADWATLDRQTVETRRTIEVVIFPDNDDAGMLYAQRVVAILRHFDSKPVIRIVSFAEHGECSGIQEFPHKGDICELCELLDGQTDEDIRGIIERMIAKTAPETIESASETIEPVQPRELECICDDAVEPKPLTYAWAPWLPYGKIVLLNGMGSVGKTSLLCSFMAVMTAGGLWPDGQKAEPGCVIYFTSEDGIEDTISQRFRAHGGYSSNMFYYQNVHNNIDQSDEEFVLQETQLLERLIDKIEHEHGLVRMVVFDPITAFTGKIDENKNNQVRAILTPLKKLAEAKGFVCVGVIHPKKGAMNVGTAAESVAGSSGYVNTARRVFSVFYDKEKAIRYMLVAKNNLLEDPPGIAFVINDGIVSYTDTDVHFDADDYLDRYREKFLRPPGKTRRASIDEVEDWLSGFLLGGAVPSGSFGTDDDETVFGAGCKKGYSKNAIYQAKKNLGIEARKAPGKTGDWVWSLPVGEETPNRYSRDFANFA